MGRRLVNVRENLMDRDEIVCWTKTQKGSTLFKDSNHIPFQVMARGGVKIIFMEKDNNIVGEAEGKVVNYQTLKISNYVQEHKVGIVLYDKRLSNCKC